MALPNQVTYTRDVRDSSDEISQGKPLVISDQIWINDPNENKALSWVLSQGVKVPTPNHTFGHLEDAPFANWVEFIGPDETGSQDTDDIQILGVQARCAAATRLYNPRTEEIMRLTLDPDAANLTTTVSRNFGRGVSTDYLLTGDKLLILPPAHFEGFTTGLGLTNTKVFKSFTTSIVSYPVRITDTESAEVARGGDPFLYYLDKSWKQAKDQMETELFLGGQVNDASTFAQNMHASEGLQNIISTNVWSVDGVLGRRDLWDILAEWTLYNKAGGAIMCSKWFIHMINEWAWQKVEINQEAKALGLDIDQVKTPDGMFDLVEVDILNQEASLAGLAFLVPKGRVLYRPLSGLKDLDIHYRPIERDEVHQEEGEIYGEYGWEFMTEEMFGVITGVEF